jgi:hypothetical protein
MTNGKNAVGKIYKIESNNELKGEPKGDSNHDSNNDSNNEMNQMRYFEQVRKNWINTKIANLNRPW